MDHLANLLSHIKNAQKKKLDRTYFKYRNKNCVKACSILYDLGYIGGYGLTERGLFIKLKYVNNRPVIRKLTLVSTVSNPVYLKKTAIKARGRFSTASTIWGFFIFSTNVDDKHFLTDVECILRGTGGKMMFFVG